MPKLTILPFRVIVTRGGVVHTFNVRGTHEMLYRLCERIDNGQGKWGQQFGPCYDESSTVRHGDKPTQYDDR